jgi:putative isomerase
MTQEKNDRELIKDYLFQKLDKVMKKPYGNYKYPFVDPGSAYDGNLWDWDTFWAVYAMINVEENCDVDPGFRQRLIEYGMGNVRNFLSFQLDDGYIPMMVHEPHVEVPYLIRKHKEGEILNMHKPFLCQSALQASRFVGDFSWFDLEKLVNFDNYGLDALLAMAQKALEHDSVIKLARVSADMKIVLDITKVYRVFDIYATVEEAVASCQEKKA